VTSNRELVIDDTCLVLAPNNYPVCLGCLGELTPDKVVLCDVCGWPLCSSECQQREEHARECRLFANCGFKPTFDSYSEQHWLYTAIGILRVLFLKQNDPSKWTHVEMLMDHWEERCQDKAIVIALKGIYTFFSKKLNLDWISQDDVNHVFGVLMTNCVSLVSLNGRACYPILSILSHSCIPNLEPISNPTSKVKLRAKKVIKKGEQLTMRYVHFLQPVWRVQKEIEREWMFCCSCERCSDPDLSDMGTYMSYLKCKCGGFYNQNLDGKYSFKCYKCDKQEDFSQKIQRFNEIENTLNQNLSNLDKYCLEIEADEYIHDMFYLKVKLFMKYAEAFQDSNNAEVLEKILERTKIVLKLTRDIDPGCSKVTGNYLLILAQTQEKLLNLKKLHGTIKDVSPKDLRMAVTEILKTKMIANKMLGQSYK